MNICEIFTFLLVIQDLNDYVQFFGLNNAGIGFLGSENKQKHISYMFLS